MQYNLYVTHSCGQILNLTIIDNYIPSKAQLETSVLCLLFPIFNTHSQIKKSFNSNRTRSSVSNLSHVSTSLFIQLALHCQ